jgi:hypothetical protein
LLSVAFRSVATKARPIEVGPTASNLVRGWRDDRSRMSAAIDQIERRLGQLRQLAAASMVHTTHNLNPTSPANEPNDNNKHRKWIRICN